MQIKSKKSLEKLLENEQPVRVQDLLTVEEATSVHVMIFRQDLPQGF